MAQDPSPTSVERGNGARAPELGGISSAFTQRGKSCKAAQKAHKTAKEIDVIDDAIADEQLLSPSLREQVAKERTGEATSSADTAAEPIELVRARLTELNERMTETGWTTVSKTGAR